MDDEKLTIKTTSEKCPCINCVYAYKSLEGGAWHWRCPKFPNGKPDEVLYDNKPCPEFEKI